MADSFHTTDKRNIDVGQYDSVQLLAGMKPVLAVILLTELFLA